MRDVKSGQVIHCPPRKKKKVIDMSQDRQVPTDAGICLRKTHSFNKKTHTQNSFVKMKLFHNLFIAIIKNEATPSSSARTLREKDFKQQKKETTRPAATPRIV